MAEQVKRRECWKGEVEEREGERKEEKEGESDKGMVDRELERKRWKFVKVAEPACNLQE